MVIQGMCASTSDCFSCLLRLRSENWNPNCSAATDIKITIQTAVQGVRPSETGDKHSAELEEYVGV